MARVLQRAMQEGGGWKVLCCEVNTDNSLSSSLTTEKKKENKVPKHDAKAKKKEKHTTGRLKTCVHTRILQYKLFCNFLLLVHLISFFPTDLPFPSVIAFHFFSSFGYFPCSHATLIWDYVLIKQPASKQSSAINLFIPTLTQKVYDVTVTIKIHISEVPSSNLDSIITLAEFSPSICKRNLMQ